MKNIIKTVAFLGLFILVISCDRENPQELSKDDNLVQEAINLLSDQTIVLSTKAKIGTTDKTLLPNGCPAKYTFTWLPDTDKMKIRLEKFKVGTMPWGVVFYAKCTFSELNNWEKQEYTEKGWLKFYANDGAVIAYVKDGEKEPIPDGAGIVNGYINPLLEEIEFVINYNMMTVSSHCFRQKIDKSRFVNFDKEFEQYEKDLIKYKEEHGL